MPHGCEHRQVHVMAALLLLLQEASCLCCLQTGLHARLQSCHKAVIACVCAKDNITRPDDDDDTADHSIILHTPTSTGCVCIGCTNICCACQL